MGSHSRTVARRGGQNAAGLFWGEMKTAGVLLVGMVSLVSGCGGGSSKRPLQAFPALAACRFQTPTASCQAYRNGGQVPNGSVVYSLHGVVRRGHWQGFRAYRVTVLPNGPWTRPLLLCARPSGGLRCPVPRGNIEQAFKTTRQQLGFYVVLQPQP